MPAMTLARAADLVCAATLSVTLGPKASAAPQPDTQATRQLEKLLAIAKEPPAQAQADFNALVEPPPGAPPGPPPPGSLAQILGVLKALEPHAFERATDTEADLIVWYPQQEGWARMRVIIEPAAPYKIKVLNLQPAPRPADLGPRPVLSAAQLGAALQEHAAALAQAGKFDGDVLVAHDGKPIFEGAYGLADREGKVPNTSETQFRFGSMGKMFTEVAIFQLVQAGKIDLKAPIGTYLKDYPNPDVAQKVTVDMLLTHTGGTGDFFGPEFTQHRLELKDPKDYVALFGARPPLFPPGTRQRYSNYGFILLGRIVEVVSGQSYDDYLARNIFAPAGMTATGDLPETVQLPHRSVSYMAGPNGQLQRADATLPFRGTPAGGGYSTTADLLRFADALMSHRLLDEAHTRMLTEGGATGPDGKLIPYEFQSRDADGRKVLGHNGGAPGMNGELRIYPASGYTVVVLANRDPPAATAMANFIGERLP